MTWFALADQVALAFDAPTIWDAYAAYSSALDDHKRRVQAECAKTWAAMNAAKVKAARAKQNEKRKAQRAATGAARGRPRKASA